MSIPSIVIRPVPIVFMLLINRHDYDWSDSRDYSPTRSPQFPSFDDDDDNDYDNDNDVDDDKGLVTIMIMVTRMLVSPFILRAILIKPITRVLFPLPLRPQITT